MTALFRVDYSGRGELSERQQQLNRHMSALKKNIFYCFVLLEFSNHSLAEEFNMAVLIVNQGIFL